MMVSIATGQHGGLRLLIVALLGDNKLASKIEPLIASELVEQIYLVRRIRFRAPKVVCYSPPGWMGKTVLLSELYRLAAVPYLCSTEDIHTLIGVGLPPHGMYVALAARLFRKPFIQIITGMNQLTFLERLPFGQKLLSFAIHRASSCCVRGENMGAYIEMKGVPARDIFIAPNVFEFPEISPEPLLPEFHIVTVASLTPVKRLDILLHAAAKLREQHEQLRVAIVGGALGSERETKRLISLSHELGLQQTVLFAGRVDHDNVVDYLNRSRVFVMTSESEGLPMAMIEAMSCGLPCVVPDVGDIAAVARHEHNALVVAPGDIDGFVSAISCLLGDENLYARLRHGALQLREEKAFEYSLDNVRRIWDQVLVQFPDAIRT